MDNRDIKPTIRRAVVIGLGGTGLLSVLYTKKTLQQYYGQIPLSVRFLAMDTTQNWEKGLRFMDREGIVWKDVVVEPQEFIYLAVQDPLGTINAAPSIKESYPKGISTEAIFNGAGAVRAHGWLGLHANARPVRQRLDRLITPLSDADLGRRMEAEQGLRINMEQGDTNIYIVGSLAGGTGSGCFTDIAFLMRHLTRGQPSKIYGFFILPWVFRGLPITGRGRININTYAALRELEYYMNFDYRRQRLLINIGGEEIFSDKPPFDLINLIDGRNENGINLVDGGTFQGVENLCELVGMSIALNLGSVGKIGSDILDDLPAFVATQDASKWNNKKPHYSSFGVSLLVYPMEKHFNRAYSLYSFLLIDDGLRISKKEAVDVKSQDVEDVKSQDVEKDIRDFCNQNDVRLLDVNNHVIDDILAPGVIGTDIQLQEGVDTPDDLKALADSEEQRIMGAVESQIGLNLPAKKEKSLKFLKGALEEREKNKGVNYSLKFAEGFEGQMRSFRESRSREIEEMESQLTSMEGASQPLLDKVGDIGFWAKITGGKKERFEEYLGQRSSIIKTKIEIKRRRASLEVFDILIKEGENYGVGMNLPEVERKLSSVRTMIYEELFHTTYLPTQYGRYAIIEEPLKIVVRNPKEVKVRASKKSWDSFGDFLEEMKIGVDFNDFLRDLEADLRKGKHLDEQLGVMGQLGKMEENELKEKITSYAQKKVSLVRDMPLEEVLQFGLEGEEEREEELKRKLRESSLRATPLWYHKAMAGQAGMMEELFIIGVGNEENTRLKTEDFGVRLLPYLSTQTTLYPPNFTSTRDIYKLFFFKYKAPLPAYLLHNMDDYRREYLATLLSMTPHTQNGMELITEDLFPFTPVEKRYLRAFTLAISPPFQLIKEKWEEKGRVMVNVYYLDDSRLVERGEEILGESKQKAYEEFGEERKRELREKVLNALKEDYQKKDPDQLKKELKEYLSKLEQKMEEEMKKLETQPDKSSFTIGEELLMANEIEVLRDFIESKGGLGDFLDKVE